METQEFRPIKCICTNLKMASRLVTRVYDSALESLGINVIQYSILINIYRYQPLALSVLAQRLEMDRTTLYRALDILEKYGHIKTTASDEGVSKFVQLTPQGKTLTLKAEGIWKKLHQEFIDTFGENKLQQFNKNLESIRKHYK